MRGAPARAPDSAQEKALLGHLVNKNSMKKHKERREDGRLGSGASDAARNLPAGPAEWSPAVVGVGRRLGASMG